MYPFIVAPRIGHTVDLRLLPLFFPFFWPQFAFCIFIQFFFFFGGGVGGGGGGVGAECNFIAKRE